MPQGNLLRTSRCSYQNRGKQLSGALQGTLQGEILGKDYMTRHASDKTAELLELGLGLPSMELTDELCLRHWSGKAAFAAAFRGPLFSVLQEVYATMGWAKEENPRSHCRRRSSTRFCA